MKLADTNYDTAETGCCARLDASAWDGKSFEWRDQLFLEDHIRSFLHIPLNYGSVIGRDHAAIADAEAYPEQPLWLTDEVSPWGSNIYVAVDRPVPNAKMVTMSGTFMTRVFEGPYRDAGKWARAMEEQLRESGREMEKLYFYYATCPKCAKHFGVNQVVVFALLRGSGPGLEPFAEGSAAS